MLKFVWEPLLPYANTITSTKDGFNVFVTFDTWEKFLLQVECSTSDLIITLTSWGNKLLATSQDFWQESTQLETEQVLSKILSILPKSKMSFSGNAWQEPLWKYDYNEKQSRLWDVDAKEFFHSIFLTFACKDKKDCQMAMEIIFHYIWSKIESKNIYGPETWTMVSVQFAEDTSKEEYHQVPMKTEHNRQIK